MAETSDFFIQKHCACPMLFQTFIEGGRFIGIHFETAIFIFPQLKIPGYKNFTLLVHIWQNQTLSQFKSCGFWKADHQKRLKGEQRQKGRFHFFLSVEMWILGLKGQHGITIWFPKRLTFSNPHKLWNGNSYRSQTHVKKLNKAP